MKTTNTSPVIPGLTTIFMILAMRFPTNLGLFFCFMLDDPPQAFTHRYDSENVQLLAVTAMQIKYKEAVLRDGIAYPGITVLLDVSRMPLPLR